MRAGDHFALGNPLFDVVDFAVQHVQFEDLVKFAASLLGQVFETGVELVDLGLFHGDRVAAIVMAFQCNIYVTHLAGIIKIVAENHPKEFKFKYNVKVSLFASPER